MLDFSVRHAHCPGVALRYLYVAGIAEDGIKTVSVLGPSDNLLITLKVVHNTYGLGPEALFSQTATILLARSAAGDVVYRIPPAGNGPGVVCRSPKKSSTANATTTGN